MQKDEPFESLLLSLEDRKAPREPGNKAKGKNVVKNSDFQNGGFLEAFKLSQDAGRREIYDAAAARGAGDETERPDRGPARRRGHADKA